MTATAQGKSLDEVSVSDLPFTVEYRAPVVTPWYMEFLPFILMIVITMEKEALPAYDASEPHHRWKETYG